jgi:AraC-like DNA-binding protein
VSCNDSVYHIKPGSFILFPPQTVHALAADQDRPFRYFCIKFNLNRIQLTGSYLPNLSFAFHKIATMTYPSLLFTQEDLSELNLHDFFVTLEREALEKKYGYDAYIYSLFSTLFLRLLRIWHCQGICFNPESISESEEQSMQDILVYLDRHSQENINIEALAHKYNMSYSYFAKLFLKHYGQSCKQYIEFIRLNKVENLLLFTDYDLNYIAAETGFADCSHLIRTFKKRYQITPRQFRQKHQTTVSSSLPAKLG